MNILKRFARFILKEELETQKAAYKSVVHQMVLLRQENKILKQPKALSPSLIFSSLFAKPVKFFDYNELPLAERARYFAASQSALRNDAIINEVNRIVADTIEEIAFSSDNHIKTENLRYSINGVKLLEERLSEIVDPSKEVVNTDPFSGT